MTALKEQDRDRLRAITQRVAKTNGRRMAYTGKILATIPQSPTEGPITRRECLAIIHPRADTEDRRAFTNAMSRLLREGKVRERPMIETGGRAVRVEPVMVLELVEQGSAAA
jgi:hypothetical protein